MKKKLLLISSLAILFVFLTCKDDDHPIIIMDDDGPPEPHVTEVPCLDALDTLTVPAINIDTIINEDQCPIPLYEIYPEKYRYTFPCFNPNNVEELAFIRTENETFKSSLCILNLCHGGLDCFEINHLVNLDWGVNNWLLFIGTDLQLWKIKPDGNNLTKLTNSGENDQPLWSPKTKEIVYWRTGVPGYFFLLDENGAVLDTIEKMQARPAFDWSNDDKLITPTPHPSFPDLQHIGYYDMPKDSIITTNDIGGFYYIYDAKWGEGNKLYWLLQFKLAYTDIETKEQVDIISLPVEFNNRLYYNFTISPDNKFIVLYREDWKQIDECSAEVVHGLYIMDIDGTNERKILIPE